jgi:excinuclease UvrABC nuclease subunit
VEQGRMSKDLAFLFYPNDWNTERTYDSNFARLPKESGVYLIVTRDFKNLARGINYKIQYVGSSENLYQRCKHHPVLRMIETDLKNCVDAVVYFKTCKNPKLIEKELIKKTQARYNRQWR